MTKKLATKPSPLAKKGKTSKKKESKSASKEGSQSLKPTIRSSKKQETETQNPSLNINEEDSERTITDNDEEDSERTIIDFHNTNQEPDEDIGSYERYAPQGGDFQADLKRMAAATLNDTGKAQRNPNPKSRPLTALSTMEEPNVMNLKVGQLAEMRTFEEGFRGAWFRCKIMDLLLKKNKIKLEYFDFPDEEITWDKIYDLPSYGRKTKQMKKQLMVRPRYPLMYHKSEMPPVNSISEVCVIIDGTWKVGDLVDWHEKNCYWSARVIKVLGDDKVQIEFPMAPAGEGGTNEAFCKDLRPSLDWSAGKGWTLTTMEGQSLSSAQLIFPSHQGMDSEEEEVKNAAASPLNASSTSRISAAAPTEGHTSIYGINSGKSEGEKMDEDVVESGNGKAASSSHSISTLHGPEGEAAAAAAAAAAWKRVDCKMDQNIMHEDTVEAAIMDLEELVNKVRWMRSILDGSYQDTSSYWEFVDHNSPSSP